MYACLDITAFCILFRISFDPAPKIFLMSTDRQTDRHLTPWTTPPPPPKKKTTTTTMSMMKFSCTIL